MKLKVWYSIHNTGDGGAGIDFVENRKLAEWDQEHLDEGWADDCSGSITITGDNIIVEGVTTNESYLFALIDNAYCDRDKDLAREFIKDFYPDGIPNLEVSPLCHEGPHYYGIWIDGEYVCKRYAHPEPNQEEQDKLQAMIDEYKVNNNG